MNDNDKKTIKKWIDVWNTASVSLHAIKTNELRAEDYYEKNFDLLNEMLWYAFENRTVKFTSGLVEQQKYFRKFYEKS